MPQIAHRRAGASVNIAFPLFVIQIDTFAALHFGIILSYITIKHMIHFSFLQLFLLCSYHRCCRRP